MRAAREPDRWVVVNNKGETLTITISAIHSDHSADLGRGPGLEKDGVEAHLQELLAARPDVLATGLRLVRREYPTDIGPVDLRCRDAHGGTVAVEIKRRGEIDGVQQLARYLERLDLDGGLRRFGGFLPPARSSHRPGLWRRRRASCASRSTTTPSGVPPRTT